MTEIDRLMDALRPDLMLGMCISARDNKYEVILYRVTKQAAEAGRFGGEDNLFASGETLSEALDEILSKLRRSQREESK